MLNCQWHLLLLMVDQIVILSMEKIDYPDKLIIKLPKTPIKILEMLKVHVIPIETHQYWRIAQTNIKRILLWFLIKWYKIIWRIAMRKMMIIDVLNKLSSVIINLKIILTMIISKTFSNNNTITYRWSTNTWKGKSSRNNNHRNIRIILEISCKITILSVSVTFMVIITNPIFSLTKRIYSLFKFNHHA